MSAQPKETMQEQADRLGIRLDAPLLSDKEVARVRRQVEKEARPLTFVILAQILAEGMSR